MKTPRNFTGEVALVTGASSRIGLQRLRRLPKPACRS